MKRQYMEIPANRTMEVTTCKGEGILMGQAVGADLDLMPYAWGQVVCVDPADMPYHEWCDAPTEYNDFGLGTFYGLMCKAGSCVINKFGRRFMDEAVDYDSLWHGFWGRDLGKNGDDEGAEFGTSWTNIPAFYICDSTVADAEASTMRDEDGNICSWVAYQSDTLEGLLDQIPFRDDYARQTASKTLESYNAYAAEGRDPEFHRGETLWDQGGTSRPASCLAPIEQGPFYCVICEPYPMCTKGGLKVNEKAEVFERHRRGHPAPVRLGQQLRHRRTGPVLQRCRRHAGPWLCVLLHRRHERHAARAVGVRHGAIGRAPHRPGKACRAARKARHRL